MKRDESGEIRLSQEELENGSFDEVATMLADETMTRGRALKLAGAALLAGSGMMALFQSPAEARKKRRRRRKKKKAVTTDPRQVDFGEQPVGSTSESQDVTIENNGTEPVYVQPQLGNGFTFSPDFTLSPDGIAPGSSVTVPVTFSPTTPGAQTGSLTIVDGSGATVETVPLTGEGITL